MTNIGDGFGQAVGNGHQLYVTNMNVSSENENPCLDHCVAQVPCELNLTSQLETSKKDFLIGHQAVI